MNCVNLTGRITRNLELRYTKNQKAVCDFNIAINRIGSDGTDFISCQVWNKQAENLHKYQGKGSLIGIVGSLRTDTYDDKDGNKRYKTYVLADNIEYLTSKPKEQKELSNTEIVEAAINEVDDPFKEFGNDIDLTDADLPF